MTWYSDSTLAGFGARTLTSSLCYNILEINNCPCRLACAISLLAAILDRKPNLRVWSEKKSAC